MPKTYRDIPGWFHDSTAAELQKLIEEHNIKTVIEVGTYLGKSAAFFAGLVDKVYAIDPFVMWPEGRQNGDAMRDGGEDFFEKFNDNMRALGLFEKVTALKNTSQDAFDWYPKLTADLVYIDAAHDYLSVKADLEAWQERAGEIICGDDYDENWPGVMQAVDEFFPDRVVVGNFWYKIIE